MIELPHKTKIHWGFTLPTGAERSIYLYTHNTTQPVFLEDVKNEKVRPWREHKMSTVQLAESYKRLGYKKSYRVADCGSFLEFKRIESELKLHKANFCKVRLCPMCSWRRSKKIFGQVSKVMDKALEENDYRFLFLTLTCANVSGEDLANQLDELFKAFNLLTKRKSVKLAVKGWFRALEVTHNLVNDTYHPHFHVILAVNKSYFTDSKQYLKQEQWTQLWKDSLKIDYTPIVDVRAFKTDSKTSVAKSVAETAKYTVKSNDFIIRDANGDIDEEMTDSAVYVLENALANRRLVAFGGRFKEIHKLLSLDDAEDGDLINTDNDELRADVEYVLERYHWHVGYSNYVRIE